MSLSENAKKVLEARYLRRDDKGLESKPRKTLGGLRKGFPRLS